MYAKHCKWRKPGAVKTCSAGVAIAKYWKCCGLSIKHSQRGTATWSCGCRSAGLASAVTCSNNSVRLSAGEAVYLNCRFWSFAKHRDMTHCIKLIMKLSSSDYIWYLFICWAAESERKSHNWIAGKNIIIWIFRDLDWLSSISVAKIMAHKIKSSRNCTSTNASLGYITPQGITRLMMLKSCSNPLKLRKVLYFATKKSVSVFDLGLFVYVYMMAGCLWIFVYILMTSSSPGSRPNETIFWLKFFWLLGCNASP